VITFLGGELVHLDQGSYAWVSLKRFEIDPIATDSELLAALIDHPQFHDHYAGEPAEEQTHHSLHGPYHLKAISVHSFVHTNAGDAQGQIRAWADSPSPSLPETHERLRSRVYPVLHSATIYQLRALGADAKHDWAGVIGANGFLEFIAIARDRGELTLAVASDD